MRGAGLRPLLLFFRFGSLTEYYYASLTNSQQTAMPADYYTLLGIPDTASLRQIKTAYRKRMKEVHPDLAGGQDPVEKRRREALAKQINEAYEVLSDPALRRRYDAHRRPGSAGGSLLVIMLRGMIAGLDWLLGNRSARGKRG